MIESITLDKKYYEGYYVRMNSSVITSKGTTTIPKIYRRMLGLTPGSRVVFDLDKEGRLYLRSVPSVSDLRRANQAVLKRNNQSLQDYKSGDGFRSKVQRGGA